MSKPYVFGRVLVRFGLLERRETAAGNPLGTPWVGFSPDVARATRYEEATKMSHWSVSLTWVRKCDIAKRAAEDE
jgi:hypothetical protein